MVTVNKDSILAKAKACMNTAQKKKEIRDLVDKAMIGQIKLEAGKSVHTPEEAANKFIEVLINSINSSGLSANVASAISNLTHGAAFKLSDGTYMITVYFNGDLSRPSLDSSRYEDIKDLANLFDTGVDHKMRSVGGKWHGKDYRSKTVIPGTHFMEQAVQDFMGNYSTEYNVTEISINYNY